MDTIKSFKGYGKVEEADQRAFQKKTRRRLVLIVVAVVVLVAVVIGVAVGAAAVRVRSSRPKSGSGSRPSTSLKAVCSVTEYPDTCLTALANSTSTDPVKIFLLALDVALSELTKLIAVPAAHISKLNTKKDGVLHKALEDCTEVFSDSVERLQDSISSANATTSTATRKHDMRTWLSAALTDHETCLDGLSEINGTAELVTEIRAAMKTPNELVSNCLAIVTKLFGIKIPNIDLTSRRRLLGAAERRLLQETRPAPDAVVAKDGSGQYTTVAAAVAAAPVKSDKRYVIYVKAGTYVENVVLTKKIWNVMIYGDGMTKTVISGSLNFIDGTPTFSTATFIVQGKGFIAKDIGFENTAGASKHQAVAFRSGSDQSVMYRCKFDGYQDTLYAHSNRQLYLGCTITGTIDFIFGNAAAVFQDCTIQPRQPMAQQLNTITAQGKKDPNQNTGIAIHKCNITPLGNLVAATYLGRPWQNFSTTVIMGSNIGSFLNPQGWVAWVRGQVPPASIFYAEYQNTGPGADVSKRVTWAGYQPNITSDQAFKYTVDTFIDGNAWLASADVTYQKDL